MRRPSVESAAACDSPYLGSPFPTVIEEETNPAGAECSDEIIYSFRPQATGSVTFDLTNMTTDHDLYVLEDVCDQAACTASSVVSGVGTDSVTFTAEVGRTYYIIVEAFGGTGSFDLSFQDNTGGCPEDCNDGIDNDNDGDTDCADTDCIGDPVCIVELCFNGIDDDFDLLVDCADPECDGVAQACGVDTGECVSGTETCSNGLLGSCVGEVAPTAEVCDGLDNNCDGVDDDGLVFTDW